MTDRRPDDARARDVSLPIHGGDLAAIARRCGLSPGDLLDFSANLNPLGPPEALLAELATAASDVAGLARYPDPQSLFLRDAIAASLDIESEAIVVGNGAAALFTIALASLRIRRCLVPTPAFSEYAHALQIVGAIESNIALDPERDFTIDAAAVDAALQREGADGLILTNPHNPSGALAEREAVRSIVGDARARGVATIVDEAFIDYAHDESIVREAACGDGTLVAIRSLTKFFAVPALRVGYAVTSPARARLMRGLLPSWPVTTLASRALAAALEDAEFADRSLTGNRIARENFGAELTAIGCLVVPSAANFLLVALPRTAPRSWTVTERLIRESRIVVRDCSSYVGLEAGDHIRVAIRRPHENQRLVDALRRVFDCAQCHDAANDNGLTA